MRNSSGCCAALCLVAIGTLALASTSASAAYQGYIHTEGKKQGASKATSPSITKPVNKPTPQPSSGARHK